MPAVRARAAECVHAVCESGLSLNHVLPAALERTQDRDKGLLQALCYQTLRHGYSLRASALAALKKAPRRKDRIVTYLLMVGLCQIRHLDIADHAAVSSSVDATGELGMSWARGLVNAVLRRELRTPLAARVTSPEVQWDHPGWLIQQLQTDWPEHWQSILRGGQVAGPMTLRVNQNHASRDDYLTELKAAGIEAGATVSSQVGVTLEQAVPVTQLPGFTEGRVSVQDESGQMVAPWLAPQAGERVLDACCAPGSKTGHLLETVQGDLALLGLDQHAGRLERVRTTLDRLGYSAELLCADAADSTDWAGSGPFDRILLDVPCSGTGVIRRHPDIKWLRTPGSIDRLVGLQQDILETAWRTLAPGGYLLYSTCSVLAAENDQQVAQFITTTADARVRQLPTPSTEQGIVCNHGVQWFPQPGAADGFYFALLEKTHASASS